MESVAGIISAVDDRRVTVDVRAAIACQRCAAGKGCGAGLLQSSDRMRQICINLPVGTTAQIGDGVELSIEPKYLLRAALLAYGLPLVTVLAVLLVLRLLPGSLNEGVTAILALCGLIFGVFLGRVLLRRDSVCDQFMPTLQRQLNPKDD